MKRRRLAARAAGLRAGFGDGEPRAASAGRDKAREEVLLRLLVHGISTEERSTEERLLVGASAELRWREPASPAC